MEVIVLHKRTPAFKAFQEYVKMSQYQCSNEKGNQTIEKDYVEETVDKCDYIICVPDKHLSLKLFGSNKNYLRGFKGFACLTIKDSYIYLDLICGRGTGGVIFTKIEELANKLNIKNIRLSAVPPAMMAYYGLYNYKFSSDSTCSQVKEVKEFANKMNSLIKNQKTLKRKRSTRQVSESMQEKNNLYEKEFIKFQELLIKHKLAHDKKCKRPSTCAIDGYDMIKCLNP